MTKTGAAARPDMTERAEGITDWLEIHSREITYVLVAILIFLAGWWLYTKSRASRAEHSALALTEAEQALNANNLALAQSDLEKLIKRYDGTPAAQEATLLLAQVLYEKGQFQQGAEMLKPLTKSRDRFVAAGAYNLMGAGYEEMNRFGDAAEAYGLAASNAEVKADRDNYRAHEARALMSAGKNQDAAKIWSELASDPTSSEAVEARVRLGELTAKAAGRS